jgi:PAS domain-containing protein
VASATRESFTDDEVAWLGTITNFLAQAWERFEAEQSLRVSEERLRLSQVAGGLGYWDYDYASGTLVWSEQTRKLLGVEPGEPASRALLRSRVTRRTVHGSMRSTSHAAPVSIPITFATSSSA